MVEPKDQSEGSSVVLAEYDDNQLRVSRTDYKGKPRLDVRWWWRREDGTWGPSKRGVNLRWDQVDELVEAIQQVAGQAA